MEQTAATPVPPPAATPVVATQTQAELEELQLDAEIESILNKMSPADKVGQLFIITFAGNDTSANSDIAELIHRYRIGGVVLKPRLGNFSNAKGTDTARQVATLVNQLQGMAYGVYLPPEQAFTPIPPQLDQAWPPASLTVLTKTITATLSLPLFIAIEQAGDDLPLTSLRNGFTPLPSQMALGATWNPDLTREIGQIVGKELHAVGINLLLGPSLDVVDRPRPDLIGGLGIHSFGGNPYWVGKLGQEYITGVHQGGNGYVATIARHFPGQGDIDRLPDQEIATIQTSLEELREISLAPFKSVAQAPSLILHGDGDPSATDGIMTSHMRYTNLPGGGTPISLGPDLLKTLEEEGLAEWRASGGVLMSNAIGVRALRRYYDPTEQEFLPRQAAVEIFNAGHDLIYLDELSQITGESNAEANWAEAKLAIIDIITLFQERYSTASTPDFAKRVDEAVRRILRLKLRLYGRTFLTYPQPVANSVISPTLVSTATVPMTSTFALTMPIIPLGEVLTLETALQALSPESLDAARAVVGQVANDALAVLKPNPQTLANVLPEAPQTKDHILIFSDSRLLYECKPGCTAEAALGPDNIAKIIGQLYGKDGTGQMPAEQIKSKTMGELAQWLGLPKPEGTVTASPTGVTTTTLPIATTSLTNTAQSAATVEGADKASGQNQNATVRNNTLTQEIEQANWIIFAMLDIESESQSAVEVVKNFLSNEYSEQLKDKKIIILALNAPYFLDATELSRATAYFGIFSKTQPFIESTVRAIFREYVPTGAPPVNVPGTDFDNLADRLKPDPNEKLAIQIVARSSGLPLQFDGENQPQVELGDKLRLVVGPILDRNGRRVPDNTLINFTLAYEGDPTVMNMEPGLTRDGEVKREITPERVGVLQIAVDAGEAKSGGPLVLAVIDSTPPTPIVLNQAPTAILTPTVTTTAIVTPSGPISTNPAGGMESNANSGQRAVDLITLAVSLLTILITLSLLLIAQVQILPRQVLVHNMLWATIFGLAAYILYGLNLLPGVSLLQQRLDAFGPSLVVFIAMLLPLLWLQLRTEQGP